jgi:hypothetical protein
MWVGRQGCHMSTEGKDTERSTVRTYVPGYQKERWRRQADEMGMSLSEFVRTMVQAGRTEFEVPDLQDDDGESESVQGTPEEPGSPDGNPGDDVLEDRIVDALDRDGYRSWNELVEAVTGDIEDRMESTLEDLQRSNRITYSGRNGGYTLFEDE